MNKKNVLWISPYAPYDTVVHAGGKNHNFYLKYLHKSGRFDITLLSLCLGSEEGKLDLQQYGIKNQIYVMDRLAVHKFLRLAFSACSVVNPFDRYAGICPSYERRQLLKLLKAYRDLGEKPDIVILQWTFAVMFTPLIRKLWDCRIAAIEEDVTFLGYERKQKMASGWYHRWFWACRYAKMRRLELQTLQKADLIVTNNPKDTALLLRSGIRDELIFTSVPYFDNYSETERKPDGKDVLFFGLMNRAENYKSALWFIDHVMPLIKDREVRFVVVGGQPDPSLLERAGSRVKIEGYVEDVRPYFERALCFAAPLLLGAGIKIKILEALSAGLPVLTNQIGIEGIPAEDGKEYFHCETAEEFAEKIDQIAGNQTDVERISRNARSFIARYNPVQKLDELAERLDR